MNHFLFADDYLIFLKADLEEVRALKMVLDSYNPISGQLVNVPKSEVMLSRNVNVVLKEAVCEELGMVEMVKHSKYLGLPIVIGNNKREIFREIEGRASKKVS